MANMNVTAQTRVGGWESVGNEDTVSFSAEHNNYGIKNKPPGFLDCLMGKVSFKAYFCPDKNAAKAEKDTTLKQALTDIKSLYPGNKEIESFADDVFSMIFPEGGELQKDLPTGAQLKALKSAVKLKNEALVEAASIKNRVTTGASNVVKETVHLASSAVKGTRNIFSKLYQTTTGEAEIKTHIATLAAKPAALQQETREVDAAMTEITEALSSVSTDSEWSTSKAQPSFEAKLSKLSPLAKKLIENIQGQKDNFITRTLTAIDGGKDLGNSLNHAAILAEPDTQAGLQAAGVSDVVIKRLVAATK